MLGWTIITIVCGLLVLGILIGYCLGIWDFDYDDWAIILLSISLIGLFLSIFVVYYFNICAKREVVEFELYTEYVSGYDFAKEGTCVFMEDENYDTLNQCVADTTIRQDVIGYNDWLTNAKAKYRTYGIFTFYDESIMELEYIIIDNEE